ncbi:MAG: DUF2813 domain-containing protein [Acidobacteria bacterium]|nr:DUF2813 domain-containing protein [Acidobacteriota bacterium]
MLLSKVRIKNFRCFRDVEVELDKTTVLIGENNSGKTSFLDAIKTCLSRNISRRGAALDDYDYYLGSETAQPDQADELSITLDFVEEDQEPADLVQALNDVLVFDTKNVRHVILRLNSKFDSASKDFVADWNFLDADGNPLGPKTKRPQLLSTFLQITPLFYLSALRDAAREFQGRSTFWAPFLRNPGIPDEVRQQLQEEISALNAEVLKAHTSLQAVKTHLAKVQKVVAIGKAGSVDIEALPGRISDLLARTQINITAPTGAPLPLVRHGAGTQSLAVIFLFEAFLTTMLAEQYDILSKPLLALEEPEAHLHPCAVRSLWAALEAVTGQKIIATHSGDLLARVPLTSVRRFCRQGGDVVVRYLKPGILVSDEQQKIDFHLQSSRGELLFARCWLLGEGESEYWVFKEASEILGHDLDCLGVRVVNTRYSGIELLVKVANHLGIAWYFVGDGDDQGQKDKATCVKYLEGRDDSKHLCVLSQPNIEILLCEHGFGHIFESHIAEQKRKLISASRGAPGYWEQVVTAQPNKEKPARIRDVMAEMRSKGPGAVPLKLKEIVEAAIALAGT